MSDRRLDSSEMHLQFICLLPVIENGRSIHTVYLSYWKLNLKKYLRDSAEGRPRENTIRIRITEFYQAGVTALQMKHSTLS